MASTMVSPAALVRKAAIASSTATRAGLQEDGNASADTARAAPVKPIIDRTIDGEPGDPMAVAYAGLYLASDEAAWVTGTNLVVDGGASAIM